jgi:nicotinate-nucleotide pyrophosphorylase (carboxylating)
MNEPIELHVRNYPDFDATSLRNAETLIELAFAEDLGTPMPCLRLNPMVGIVVEFIDRPTVTVDRGNRPWMDLTSETTIPENARGSARFVARQSGVVAGLPVVDRVACRFGLATWLRPLVQDGDRVDRGTALAEIAGSMRALLMFERTALNFLQRLSGVATLTAEFVAEVAGTKAVILDTRKTTPGARALEKYAVRRGGGVNHRFGLYDAVLIKDNHLAWLAFLGQTDPIGAAVAAARAKARDGTVVEVEVDSLEQFDRAIECKPDIILVDNLGPDALAEAVRRRDARAPGIQLEASGGVNLKTVGALARTGVDRISVGALTHSAPALDIGLDFDRSLPS